MANRLKMWIGNLDGRRQGLVIARSKACAREILHAGRTEFDGYWVERPVDETLEPGVLYTRPLRHDGAQLPWQRGLCTIERTR